jgi:hypothetical protein
MNTAASSNAKPAILPITMPATAPFEVCDFFLLPCDTVALEEVVVLVLAVADPSGGVDLITAVNDVEENGVGSAIHEYR